MPGTVLIIDDSDMLREGIKKILREADLFSEYCGATDGIEGLKLLMEKRVDLVICDLEMPRLDGFKFMALMRGRNELRDIPVIMVTGKEDTQSKIKGLEQGASDYVTKPFNAGELVARVKVQMKIKSLQDELRRSNELLLEISNTDHLTSLFNRRYMMDATEREFQRTYRNGGFFSLIMFDIDHFKSINDRYGHQEGDVVLVAIANLAKKLLRPYDFAARYGGEEFALVLTDTTGPGALQVAERVRKGVEGLDFEGKLAGLSVTASFGVATYPSEQVYCVEALIRHADNALYRAKELGRNRVETGS